MESIDKVEIVRREDELPDSRTEPIGWLAADLSVKRLTLTNTVHVPIAVAFSDCASDSQRNDQSLTTNCHKHKIFENKPKNRVRRNKIVPVQN